MERLYKNIIQSHFGENRQMAIVSGPRQVGKTTLAQTIRGNADTVYFNWDDFDDPAEGCLDQVPFDGFCDLPFVFLNGHDDLPWTQPISMPAALLLGLIGDLQDIVVAQPEPVADKVEDVLANVQTAFYEHTKMPPDNQAAAGAIEGAVGDLDVALGEGFDAARATQLMDSLAACALQLAQEAIDEAIARGGDPVKIQQAQGALASGDVLRFADGFKDAVALYKDAISKAEGA